MGRVKNRASDRQRRLQGRRVVGLSRRQVIARDAHTASVVAADYLAELRRAGGADALDAQDAAERDIIDSDGDETGEAGEGGDHDDNGDNGEAGETGEAEPTGS